MAWETRARGGQYYTRSKREGGRVIREYVGSGLMAQLQAHWDAQEREEQEEARERQKRTQKAEEEGLRRVQWYCRSVETILHAELSAAGYHRHDRGQWRRKRQERENTEMATAIQQQAQAEREQREKVRKEVSRPRIGAEAIRAAIVPETRAEREKIFEAAMDGDAALEAQALACIRAFPAEAVLGWGNPMHPCLKMISLREDTARSRVFRERVEQEYTRKLKQIAGENPTPLETLLAERIVVLRFQITHFERTYEAALEKGLSAVISDHHVKRLDRLNKQYVRAIEALAKVRRLQLPVQLPTVMVGQMNIGDKQVNIGEKQLISGAV